MDEPTKQPADEVVVAETVFLLMTKEHRISKHLRAKWYLEHVDTIMEFPDHAQKIGHPQLVSVITKNGKAIDPGPDGRPVKFKLGTDTTVNFLSTHHDIVFAVDVSFSSISSSTADSEVLFDGMYRAIRAAVSRLTKTFIIPGTKDKLFTPYIYVTVIAYCPIINCPVPQVLTHGYLVTYHNVDEFMEYISRELNKFENLVAGYTASIFNQGDNLSPETGGSATFALFEDDVDDQRVTSLRRKHSPPEKAFFYLIKSAMLAVQLLPTNCSSGIIVVTDGNVGIGDVGRYDNLLIQLLSQSCTCSIIEVQCQNNETRGLGRVPHSEMLQFIATATFGAYFTEPSMETDIGHEMNEYHRGVLCWDFKKSIKDFSPPPASIISEENLWKKHGGYSLAVPINCVITTRLKEGFTIKAVEALKENFIEVTMLLPWRKGIVIEYKASSCWPVPTINHNTNIEIFYGGNYPFLHDLICKKSKTNNKTATKYRQSLVQRFWKCVLSLKRTDDCLVIIQAFHVKDDFYTIPDSIKKGQHLFYSTYSTQTSLCEIKHHREGPDINSFASFWKIVLSLDLGATVEELGIAFDRSSHIMEKWFHIHRVYMVLEHDPDGGEYVPANRYHRLQCRHAHQALINKLREFADFELLESSHFIKYIKRKDQDTPSMGYYSENWQTFCMIVMNFKDACLSLRLTFLGGTDSIYRATFIDNLKEVVRSIKFPKQPDSALPRKKADSGQAQNHKPPLNLSWDERQCCILMSKPLDRVLIRYPRIPRNLLTVDNIDMDVAPAPNVPSRLGNYLYHRRWVWSLQPNKDSCQTFELDTETVTAVLDIITKVRLQEGYHFAYTNTGIVSMLLEVDMTNEAKTVPKEDQESLSCLVQYISFPPQRMRKANSTCESEQEDELCEMGAELSLVTEVWIEPQHGFAINNTPERMTYNGCTFSTWPEKILDVDRKCIHLMITLEHLLKWCNAVNTRNSTSSSHSSRAHGKSNEHCDSPETEKIDRVIQIPYNFSVIELLPMCSQTEIILPTYAVLDDVDEFSNASEMGSGHSFGFFTANDLLFRQIMTHLESYKKSVEISLTDEDCVKFMEQVVGRIREFSSPGVPFRWPPPSENNKKQSELFTTQTSCDNGSPSYGFNAHQESVGSFADSYNLNDSHTTKMFMDDTDSTHDTPPQWKCFCFPTDSSSDQIALMFLPASYSDLTRIGITEPIISDDAVVDHKANKRGTKTSLSGDVPKKPADVGLILPVYIYYCSKPLLTDILVNGTTHMRKSDEYLDFRYEDLVTSARDEKSFDPHDDGEHFGRRRLRTESSSRRPGATRSFSVDSNETGIDLTNICVDIFHKSFVTGIFLSLQEGKNIASNDIESAISVCEEDVDDIQLTDFLKHVCSHMRHLGDDPCKRTPTPYESAPSTPKNVKFADQDFPVENANENISKPHSKPSTVKSYPIAKIGLNDLFERPCHRKVSMASIKEKFINVLADWFTPIPTCPDVFYYSPKSVKKDTESDIDHLMYDSGDKPYTFSKQIERTDSGLGWQNAPPLFIHLTASVNCGKYSNHIPIPIKDIPTCITELKDCFKDLNQVDVNNLDVTLDIISRTLPHSLIPESVTDGTHISNNLVGISETQKADIAECKKNVEWLVRNEIAAAVRSTGPVTEQTLKMVVEHVKNSQDLSNDKKNTKDFCRYAKEHLKYVFGADISHQMFLEEFERIDVKGFRLEKKGQYYYLSCDRSKHQGRNSAQMIFDHAAVASKLNIYHRDSEYKARVSESSMREGRSIEAFQQDSNSSLSGLSESPASGIQIPDINGERPSVNQPLPSDRVPTTSRSEDKLSHTSDSVDVIEEEVIGLQIPNAHSHSIHHGNSDSENEESARDTLNSLPKHNAIYNFMAREEGKEHTTGSLREAYSSGNVNLEGNSLDEKSSLGRVHSFPTSLLNGSSLHRKRHVSEDVGMLRKRTTFADDVRTNVLDEADMTRSRNLSGALTPASYKFASSNASGYDADFSDDEGPIGDNFADDTIDSDQYLPSFWIVMDICAESSDSTTPMANKEKSKSAHIIMEKSFYVEVVYHASEDLKAEGKSSEGIKLFNEVIAKVRNACKVVNQRLLLQDLFNKRKCDPLLEEEQDPELFKKTEAASRKSKDSDSDADVEQKSDDEYLAARMTFIPGHFKCEKKWSKAFTLHQRLKSGKTRGFNALKSALDNFRITNRTNMFVHKQALTGNIFYIRLSDDSKYDSSLEDSKNVGYMSRSSSQKSLSRIKDDSDSSRRQSITDADETQSTISKASRKTNIDDTVMFTVYGIDEVGSDIKVDMIKMLESRLDESVLMEIENLLSRNSNCMLTTYDVNFIQRQELPNKVLKVVLPDKTLHHQKVILHYLRQNLLQPEFLFHPKYQDPETNFMDYSVSIEKAEPMCICNTFLYTKSSGYQKAGKGAGLALIYLQLTDSSDYPIRLFDCKKPEQDAWRMLTSAEFKSLTEVNVTHSDMPARPLSTSSYIRFSIWSKGSGMDLDALEQQLMKSVQHALCDFVFEYFSLTAPICEVPHSLHTQLHQAVMQPEDSLSEKGTIKTPNKTASIKTPLSRSKSSYPSSAFTFQEESKKQHHRRVSPTPSLSDSFCEAEMNRHYAVHREIDKYRFGEKGQLLPFYTATLLEWFDYCDKLNLPAVSKLTCGLLNNCIVESVIKEFEAVVKELSGFCIQPFKLEGDCYVPYQSSKTLLSESEELSEVAGQNLHLGYPYSSLSQGHILIARNKKLWLQSIGDLSTEESSDVTTPLPGSVPRNVVKNQKFPPQPSATDKTSSNSLSQCVVDKLVLPRQQFIMLIIKNAEMVLYTYNLADGKDEPTQRLVKSNALRIARWNNARYHVLNCIAHQKMGLFQHLSINKIPSEKHCQDRNTFAQTVDDVQSLVKTLHPPVETSSRPTNAKLSQAPGKSKIVPASVLDRVYFRSKPSKPMHLCKSIQDLDPISRHGTQLMETYKSDLRDQDRRKKLEKLYYNWQQRVGPVSTEIPDEELDILKQSSRLVHFVATPLLFSPKWRQRAMNLPRSAEPFQKPDENFNECRSRNSSGASIQSRKLSTAVHPSEQNQEVLSADKYEEESWHEELRTTFVNNYIDYLRQTQQPLEQLGFTTIKSKPAKGIAQHHRKKSNGGLGVEQFVKTQTVDSLQKTMAGGIFLVELSFQECYFILKLYVFSASQLIPLKDPIDNNKKQDILTYFIEVCDRMRDYTHCHSFAYDFHLRTVHKFIKNTKDPHSKFNIVEMLKDFSRYYEDSPMYARNALYLETIDLDVANNPCSKLYRHILKSETYRSETFKMKKVAMSFTATEDKTPWEFALVSQFPMNDNSARRIGDYEASTLVTHDHPQADENPKKGKLDLSFFVILVNKEQYPDRYPHAKASQSDNNLQEHFDSQTSMKQSNSKQIQMYLTKWTNGPGIARSQERRAYGMLDTYMNQPLSPATIRGQHPAYSLLIDQSKVVKSKLVNLVHAASLQFRGDSLWQQIVSPVRKKRSSNTDVFPYDETTKLTFTEFDELLQTVPKETLNQHGSLVQVLDMMPHSWFASFTKVLAAKYDDMYKEFISPDGQLVHSVLLMPDVDDAILLMSIYYDSKKTKLQILYKDEPTASDFDKRKALLGFYNTLCFHMWAQMAS